VHGHSFDFVAVYYENVNLFIIFFLREGDSARFLPSLSNLCYSFSVDSVIRFAALPSTLIFGRLSAVCVKIFAFVLSDSRSSAFARIAKRGFTV
jgi:hypothetical protein